MIILYIVAKNKCCVIKTIILKRPKKKGTILRKMLTTYYGIKKIDGDTYPGGKGVITHIFYIKCNEFIPIKSFKNAIFVKNRPFLEVKVNIHPEYDPEIFKPMLEHYFEGVARTDTEAYQMNLIKT
ncbi:MAG: hypothetical protein [Asgard archaea virus SkuldV2]|nr:MAG: hypothetical protein [Asgard archaea virus SkuldV2]